MLWRKGLSFPSVVFYKVVFPGKNRGKEDEEIDIRLGTCHMLGAGTHTMYFSSTSHNGVQCWCYYPIL